MMTNKKITAKLSENLKRKTMKRLSKTNILHNDPYEIMVDNLLTIEHAQKFRERLLEALKFDNIKLASGKFESVDLTAIQLLHSLYQTLRNKGGKITIHIALNEEQRNLLENTGIYDIIFCDNTIPFPNNKNLNFKLS